MLFSEEVIYGKYSCFNGFLEVSAILIYLISLLLHNRVLADVFD